MKIDTFIDKAQAKILISKEGVDLKDVKAIRQFTNELDVTLKDGSHIHVPVPKRK